MEERKYTMAELLAEEDERLKQEAIRKAKEDELRKEQEKLEREQKRKEYLEAKRLEALKPKDRTITCKKCGNEFVWTIAEQEFYKEKGFFKPSYCKDCRKRCKVVNNFHKDM